LVGCFPVFGDCAVVFGADFVVQDLVINSVATGLKARRDTCVVWNAMAVGLGLKGFLKNCIGVAVIC
jgi:hypothetical protein